MLHLSSVLPLLITAAAAQHSVPVSLQAAANDLNHDSAAPLMGPGCRIQQFYELREVGSQPGVVTIAALSLRFDGPTGGGSAVTHSIDSLEIRVGSTHRNVDRVGSVFDANLTRPLTTVFQASNWTFVTDATTTPGPQPWGGPGGQLRFQLAAPVTVVIPDGGSLVIELLTRGNSNGLGGGPAWLDFWVEPGAVTVAGTSLRNGFGCGATLETRGQFDPGTAFFTSGANYAPSHTVFTLLTARLLPVLWTIPGTPGCWLYVDLATGGVIETLTPDPSGEVSGGGIPLPRVPQLCGGLIYLQNLGTAPATPSNPAGLVTSNYQTIQIGCTAPPVTRGWSVSDNTSADARIGTMSRAGGLALLIE